MSGDKEGLRAHLKELIVRRCSLSIQPTEIGDDQPLFGNQEGSLGLDSIEALEIAVAIEDEFRVRIDEGEEAVARFYSIATLAEYIHELEDGGS